MKTTVSVQQLIVVIAIVVVLVFVATYASITIGGGGGAEPKPAGPEPVRERALLFTEDKLPRELVNKDGQLEIEVQTPYHYEFWFENKKDVPLQLKLQAVACKCTTVDVALLPEDARGKTKEQLDELARSGVEWKELARDGSHALAVPARGLGGIRLNWKGERTGPDRIAVELAVAHSGGGEVFTLGVPVDYVDPIRTAAEDGASAPAQPNEVHLGVLQAREESSAKFLCWSSSRKGFKLQVVPPADPCVTCSDPVPLPEEECSKLQKDRGTRFLSGYRLTVKVQERTESGRQLDLGFFRRRVKLKSDGAEAEVLVNGIVRGEVTVGTIEDRDLIDFKSFMSSDGAVRSLTLTTELPSMELEIATAADLGDRKDRPLPHPDFVARPELEDRSKPGGVGKIWLLTVRIPPNAHTGPIPRDSAVYLKIKGEKPRFIRIPIVGNAYVK